MEPDPSNVSGEVVERHEFKHVVNWSHVAVALAIFAVLYVGFIRDSGRGTNVDGSEAEVSLSE